MYRNTSFFVSISAQIGVIILIIHIVDPNDIGYDRFKIGYNQLQINPLALELDI